MPFRPSPYPFPIIRILLWLFLSGAGPILSNGHLFSQAPVYYVIGEQTLANSEVYSLLFSREGTLYASTNRGVFYYQMGDFHPIQGPAEQIGKSLFNLVETTDGSIFCHNLSGQIFKVEGRELTLFYTLNPEMLSPNIVLRAHPLGGLVVGSDEVFRISPQKEVSQIQIQPLVGPISAIEVSEDNQLVITANNIAGLWTVNGETATFRHFLPHPKGLSPQNQIIPFLCRGQWAAMDGKGELFFTGSHPSQGNYQPRGLQRTFRNGIHSLWAMQGDQGVVEMQLDGDKLVCSNPLLSDYFISAMCQGEAGSLFMGTFGDGVLVIPQPSAKQWGSNGASNRLSGLCNQGEDTLFLANKSGNMIRVVGEDWDTLCLLTNQFVERLLYLPGWGGGSCAAAPDIFMNGALPISNVKDAAIWKDGQFFAGTTFGMYLIRQRSSVFQKVADGRINAVATFPDSGLVYYATSEKCWKMQYPKDPTEVQMQGKSLRVSSLATYGQSLIIGTESYGVWELNGDTFLKLFPENPIARSPAIHRVKVVNGSLYIAHNEGFSMIDLQHHSGKSLLASDGLALRSVKDFAVLEDHIWLLSNKNLTRIPLPLQWESPFRYQWQIDSLCASGLCFGGYAAGKDRFELKSAQNNIEIHYTFTGLIAEKDAQMAYRFDANDTAWHFLPVTAGRIAFPLLKPGDYSLRMKVVSPGAPGDEQLLNWTILPLFYQTWWFLTCMVLGLMGLVAGLFAFRIRTLRRRSREEMSRREMEKNVLESKLKAIRSQMNPHFIFNSLNSIQDLILQQDTDNAYDYVVLFSELVRSTLKFSEREFLPLSEEIDFLEVYLSLEKLRFKEDFTFSIEVDGDPDILLPSLLVQPFVENALQHGLMHKKGPKTLNILFQVGDILEITLTDNGIGREAAQKIKDRQSGGHPSFSLSAIRQRMEILKGMAGMQAEYFFRDLNEGDAAAGTQAIIRLSYRKAF